MEREATLPLPSDLARSIKHSCCRPRELVLPFRENAHDKMHQPYPPPPLVALFCARYNRRPAAVNIPQVNFRYRGATFPKLFHSFQLDARRFCSKTLFLWRFETSFDIIRVIEKIGVGMNGHLVLAQRFRIAENIVVQILEQLQNCTLSLRRVYTF